jgi:hypothetical protein
MLAICSSRGNVGRTISLVQASGIITCTGERDIGAKVASGHIEHMSAFFSGKGLGYSFESLGEDMPAMREALSTPTQGDRG